MVFPENHTIKGRQRLRVMIYGAVQGVGFRPFIYRLAVGLGLKGWVSNSAQGVLVEAEGEREVLEDFLLRIQRENPSPSYIQSLEYSFLDPAGYGPFAIRASQGGRKTALVLPDIATCPDCLREARDPANRRYLYPFTNCTHCGPRYSIIEGLPYDRPATTMKIFKMCAACRHEYENPLDRRFHAQPNACPECGPQLALWDPAGLVCAERHEALLAAARAIREGRVVAVKGLGGFHLMVDARNEEAVRRLRRLKGREEKPLALMVPSLVHAREQCLVSALEERSLVSPESPIVLLRRGGKWTGGLAPSIAPDNPYLGVMLPYTPLHHLLLDELGFAVVATSGNVSDEPICTDEREALARLGGMADLFLVHNRPIARHVDDSIVRLTLGREQVLRRARGYAPLPVEMREALPAILAVGAHLKNTVAIAVERQIFVSQHIGDLETKEAYEAFERVIGSLEGLYDFRPVAVACDAHPDYLSTRFAQALGVPVVAVQHHYAHVLGCMAENQLDGPALGVAWDGTGLGTDRTIWGGEFLRVSEEGFARVAHLRTFRLPGGEQAIKEPRRSALGLLYEMLGEGCFAEAGPGRAVLGSFAARELGPLRAMLAKGLNAPLTSSAGRLFDAVAALVGLQPKLRFEGQAAMKLEFALAGESGEECYDFALAEPAAAEAEAGLVVDWAPMVRQILTDMDIKIAVGKIAQKFHNTLVEMMIAVARRAGEARVVLTGGCFQNQYLLERAVVRLRAEGFQPYWPQRIPPNDGGIALGQAVAAGRVLSKEKR